MNTLLSYLIRCLKCLYYDLLTPVDFNNSSSLLSNKEHQFIQTTIKIHNTGWTGNRSPRI